MKTLVQRLVILVLVVAAAGAGWAFFKGNGKSTKNLTTYEEGEVSRGDVRSFVTATGVIQPWKVVDVKSNVAGRIDKLHVDLGHTVTAGQPIADIDPTDTQTAYDQAGYDLVAAQARKRQAEQSVRQQETQAKARIESANRALANAQARAAEAKANRDVQPDLTQLGIDQARAQEASAEKSLLQARRTKTQLEQQLSQVREVTVPLNVRTVDTTVTQAKANLLQAENEYNRQKQLLAQGFVARSDVEQAYARMKTQQASVDQSLQRQQTMKRENELTIRELEARVDSAQASIEEAEARVRQAQASLRVAQKGEVQNEVREQGYKAALAAVAQAKAELEGAQAELTLVKVRQQDVASAQQTIFRSEAQRKQAKVNLGFTKVVAPRGGVIIAKNVEEGTVVPSSRASIGSTNALLQIGDVSRLWVVCDVDETDIGQVMQGQKVTVKVDAYPSLVIEGKVIRIDPQAKVEQNVTLIPVTVEINQPDPRFKPLMNATCEFIVDEANDVVTVPNEAVKEKGEGEFYVQQLVNGKPADVPIEVGLAGPDTTEIRSGLEEGAKVITRTIEPEQPQTNNPFGGPFGGRPRSGGSGGRSGGGGGGRR